VASLNLPLAVTQCHWQSPDSPVASIMSALRSQDSERSVSERTAALASGGGLLRAQGEVEPGLEPGGSEVLRF